MIPSRPTPPPTAPAESIPARLARLRSEQRASSRPRFSSGFSTASSSTTPRWLHASDEPPSRPVRQVEGRRGTAGPPPPPSWTTGSGGARDLGEPDKAVQGTNRARVHIKPDVERWKLVAPLLPSRERAAGAVPSLFEGVGRVVAADLARGSGEVNQGSLLMEHVAYLPPHLKLRLLDVFADWKNDCPLTNEGARQLLRTDVDELEEGGDGTDGDDDDEGWDRDIPDVVENRLSYHTLDDFSSLATHLTRLNLSFSTTTIGTLRSLLLRPSTSTLRSTSTSTVPSLSSPAPAAASSQPPTSVKLLPTFPHLHTLLLVSMPHLPLSDQLFDLLSAHLSLRTLSLAGNILSSCVSVVNSSTFLPRLSAATPNLRSLDVSYMTMDSPVVVVKGVDWDERWRDLRVLGLRSKWTSCTRTGEEVGDESKERLRREVWASISAGRRRKRRWIEVVV
ncbi:hypothetical protein JCM1841_005267 [Sporobolomyces salmonicolor]